MKNKMILFLAAVLLLSLCACGAGEKSLIDHGLDVIAQMDEMVQSDAFLDMYTGSGEIRDILSGVKAPHGEPTAVYSVSMPENAAEMWALAETGFGELSPALQERVLSQTYGPALISQVNARGGAATLAAATVCTGGKTFVSKAAEGGTLYIYAYADACPVAVAFAEGEDDAFYATGMFILDATFDASSQEAVASAFAELGAVVSPVNQ